MVFSWLTPQICPVATLLQVLSLSELRMVVILNRCPLNLSLCLTDTYHVPDLAPCRFPPLFLKMGPKHNNWCLSPLVISCWRQLIVHPGNIHNAETLSNLDDWDTAGGDFFKSVWDPKEMNTSVAHFCWHGDTHPSHLKDIYTKTFAFPHCWGPVAEGFGQTLGLVVLRLWESVYSSSLTKTKQEENKSQTRAQKSSCLFPHADEEDSKPKHASSPTPPPPPPPRSPCGWSLEQLGGRPGATAV